MQPAFADNLFVEVIAGAKRDLTSDSNFMAHAILSGVLAKLSQFWSRKAIDSIIDFELDKLVDLDMFITLGC